MRQHIVDYGSVLGGGGVGDFRVWAIITQLIWVALYMTLNIAQLTMKGACVFAVGVSPTHHRKRQYVAW